MRDTYTVALLVCGLFVAGLPGCGPSKEPGGEGDVDFGVESVAPETVLPGTRLKVLGSGFRADDSFSVRFDGGVGGESVSFSRAAEFVDEGVISTTLDAAFFEAMGTKEGRFSGEIFVEVTRGEASTERSRQIAVELTESLEPTVDAIRPKTAAFMDKLAVEGSGLLLEGEGKTVLKATGHFDPKEGPREAIDEKILALEPNERTRSWYVHTPEAFGLRTGTFEGTVTVENWHDGSGGDVAGNETAVSLEVQPPQIDQIDPKRVSRGQRIGIFGAGFVPRTGEAGQRTSLVLTGTFTDTAGNTETIDGSDALTLAPKFVESGVLEYVIRPEVDRRDDELHGLGSEPGVFDGEVVARIHRDGEFVETSAQQVEVTILPTKQVVHLKYLPGFSEALRKFGLRNVEEQVRARVLEVCERDYSDYNVECREEPPEDYADYVTIEIGGRDPNGGSFFGLDNSEGVDRGNLRLDEVVGGRRATDEEGENFMFGGVFVESFLVFSPSLKESIPIESKKFDEIFGPFSPKLDGKPVQADEYPSGSRTTKIDRAIRVLGNLAGNTAVHEVGHALGLANTGIPGEVHHAGINPGLIMNGGADRSFERRAEIDGTEPGHWGKRDSEYLEEILPRP